MPTRTDQHRHGKGTEAAGPAIEAGLVGGFKTLVSQHRDVSVLLDRVKADPDKRFDLWPQIRRELLSHERGEVRELYPSLRARPDTRALAEQHDREANELELAIEKLDHTAIGSAAWVELFEDLALDVAEHAKHEETTIFPRAQAAIGEAAAHDLDARFLRAKRAAEASV